MPDWETSEPPLDREIEYQRDNGEFATGQIERAGKFGTGRAGSQPRMRQQYRNFGEKGLDLFEVKRWRDKVQTKHEGREWP